MPLMFNMRDIPLQTVFLAQRQFLKVQADPPLRDAGPQFLRGDVADDGFEENIVIFFRYRKTAIAEGDAGAEAVIASRGKTNASHRNIVCRQRQWGVVRQAGVKLQRVGARRFNTEKLTPLQAHDEFGQSQRKGRAALKSDQFGRAAGELDVNTARACNKDIALALGELAIEVSAAAAIDDYPVRRFIDREQGG